MHPEPARPVDQARHQSRHVVLVGLMGTGKSTVGKRLAVRLGRPFVDTDARLETLSGRTIRSIFETDGEEAFRDVESNVLTDVLESPNPSVVAAGGGIVLREPNRRLLQQTFVVWLRADPTMLANRLRRSARRGATHRPLIDDDPLGKLNQMNADRSSMYDEVSTVVVDVDQLSPDQIVEQCVRAFTESPS
ncbi:MAG: shikimate kinase [Acidimicrobiia bacterium]|nr:shikimate kinase [Actinomycetota bacterium]NDE59995.1 shikimate kinase [Acidimicrobiia bacterium]NDE80661.1 shikimate kinase [Actinomycetota bacterium]NDF31676.1 shikimate kinase [Acidimicrobiia bacterium]